MYTDICTYINFPCVFQLTPEFSQRLCCKIHELLSVMENGLKSADPRDCTSYTGWAGKNTNIYMCKDVTKCQFSKNKFLLVFLIVSAGGET